MAAHYFEKQVSFSRILCADSHLNTELKQSVFQILQRLNVCQLEFFKCSHLVENNPPELLQGKVRAEGEKATDNDRILSGRFRTPLSLLISGAGKLSKSSKSCAFSPPRF